MFDPLVQGETGRSLVTPNAMVADRRRTLNCMAAVAAVVAAAASLAIRDALCAPRGAAGALADRLGAEPLSERKRRVARVP